MGETSIDLRVKDKNYDNQDKIIRIYFDTSAEINPEATKAIINADKIVFSQGDLYTSVLPHLLVNGVREAISKSKAKLIFILNLMTKPGETDGYKASDFIKRFLYYLDLPGRLNFALVNANHLDPEIVRIYKEEGQKMVSIDEKNIKKVEPKVKIIKKSVSVYLKKEHLLRHDPIKLAKVILRI